MFSNIEILRYVKEFCRVAIAALFLFSATSKTVNLQSFQRTISNFRLLPNLLIKAMSWSFLIGEFLIAIVMIIGGESLLLGFGLAAILLLVFTFALASALIRKLPTSCNCFGSYKKPVSAFDLARNSGIIGFALIGGLIEKNSTTITSLQLLEYIPIIFIALASVLVMINLEEIIKTFT